MPLTADVKKQIMAEYGTVEGDTGSPEVQVALLTQRIKDSWADSIRLWGNAATHELKSVRQSTAMKAIEFTRMILRMAFEFEGSAKAENGS